MAFKERAWCLKYKSLENYHLDAEPLKCSPLRQHPSSLSLSFDTNRISDDIGDSGEDDIGTRKEG